MIREIHFSYRNGDERGLYEMEDLSDGELMWLAPDRPDPYGTKSLWGKYIVPL